MNHSPAAPAPGAARGDVMAVPRCATCPHERPAVQRLRILPRRDVDPLNEDIRRATAWPGQAAPVWVPSCGQKQCHDLVRSVAVSILAAEALDGETVVQRTVKA